MIEEWKLSNRRGTLVLSSFAVVSAIFACIQFRSNGDVRWLVSGTIVLASWPYAYFVIIPVNIWLLVIPLGRTISEARQLMLDWELLEWASRLDRICRGCVFVWA